MDFPSMAKKASTEKMLLRKLSHMQKMKEWEVE